MRGGEEMVYIKKVNTCAPQGCFSIGIVIFRVEVGIFR